MNNTVLTRAVSSPVMVAQKGLSYSLPLNTLPDVLYYVAGVTPAVQAQMCPQCRLALQICYMYGLRIGEVLQATTADILPASRIIIHAEKGGADCIIYLPNLKADGAACAAPTAPLPLFSVDYQRVYREAKKAGISISNGANRNASVTHAGRKTLARTVAHVAGKRTAGDVLHHRAKTTIDHYLYKKKSKQPPPNLNKFGDKN